MKYPDIPMSPEELPQQRIREVIDLPPRPEMFESVVGYGVLSCGTSPDDIEENGLYLCQVEWAWSPMHNRLDAYYLMRDGSEWVLWNRYWDDNWGQWDYWAVGKVASAGIDRNVASVHLLIDFWTEERDENDVDHYHWINETAALDVVRIAAIADRVWKAR